MVHTQCLRPVKQLKKDELHPRGFLPTIASLYQMEFIYGVYLCLKDLLYSEPDLETKKNLNTGSSFKAPSPGFSDQVRQTIQKSPFPKHHSLSRWEKISLPPGTPESHPPAAGSEPEHQGAAGSLQSPDLHADVSSRLGHNLHPTHRLVFHGPRVVTLQRNKESIKEAPDHFPRELEGKTNKQKKSVVMSTGKIKTIFSRD